MYSWCNTCKSWRSSFQWMIERTFPHKQSATVFDVVFLTIKKKYSPFFALSRKKDNFIFEIFSEKRTFF